MPPSSSGEIALSRAQCQDDRVTSEPTLHGPALQDELAFDDPPALLLVKLLQMIARALIDEALKEEKLTAPQYIALTFIRDRGPVSSAELARRCFVKPQTMHQIITGYVQRGLVQKQRDPASRRTLLVSLTDEGQAMLRRCQPTVDELENRMMEDLSPGQRLSFREYLQHGVAVLSAEAYARDVVPDSGT